MARNIWMITRLCGKLRFPVGFCESWEGIGHCYFVYQPFSKGSICLPKGTFHFRGDWAAGRLLPLKQYRLSVVSFESWMQIELPEALAAIDLCKKFNAKLPKEGFSRLNIL